MIMGKARLLFFIFIYSMFAMACSPEPEILSGNNSETEISNGNNNQDEENTNNDNQNNNEENMSIEINKVHLFNIFNLFPVFIKSPTTILPFKNHFKDFLIRLHQSNGLYIFLNL